MFGSPELKLSADDADIERPGPPLERTVDRLLYRISCKAQKIIIEEKWMEWSAKMSPRIFWFFSGEERFLKVKRHLNFWESFGVFPLFRRKFGLFFWQEGCTGPESKQPLLNGQNCHQQRTISWRRGRTEHSRMQTWEFVRHANGATKATTHQCVWEADALHPRRLCWDPVSTCAFGVYGLRPDPMGNPIITLFCPFALYCGFSGEACISQKKKYEAER